MRKEKIKNFVENITPKAFEELCVDYMKITRGDNLIIKGTRYVKDGGKDIIGTHNSIPYEIWAECKKHSKSIGLSELSKNVVLVISENINELIYFSVSDITEDAQKHISNVAAKHGFGLSFYFGDNLFEEFLKLPLFEDEEDEKKDIKNVEEKALNIKYFLTKYKYSSIYEKDFNISLQRDNHFYIDIYLKNAGNKKIKDIQFKPENSSYFEYYIRPYNQNFSLNSGCDRIVQVKCEILNNKQKCKIPNIKIKYILEDDISENKMLTFGFAEATNVLYIPLIGENINSFILNFNKTKLSSNELFPYILNICGSSGVGKTRMIKELEALAEKNDWKIKRYDAKKQNDFSIVKELLSSFIGIPYYNGNINVTLENIKNILQVQNKSLDRAEKIFKFLFGESLDNELVYYIEDTFIYYLINPWYPNKYFISIDNIQELDENVTSFFNRIFLKLENIETKIIFVLGTNTDFPGNTEFNKLSNTLKNYEENYCVVYNIEDMSYPDALLLYSQSLNNPGIDILSMLVDKSGRRPYDIIMTIKYLQDQNVLKWHNNSVWYIEDYDKFYEFLTTIPKPNEQMLSKRLKLLKERKEFWVEFVIVIKSLMYFQGKVPFDFLQYINIEDIKLEEIIESAFVKYDDKSPDVIFFHDNILRFFSNKLIYSYDKKIANSIIKWFGTLDDDEKPENVNHILFKCFLDTKSAELAYKYGVISAKEYENNYNFKESNKIWSTILNKIELNVSQEFDIRFSLANSFREHLSQNKGAESFNKLYQFYKDNKNEINLNLKEKDNFFHRLINANLITDNLHEALQITKDFEKTDLSSEFYRLILFDRYALIYLGLGELEKSEENIKKAKDIAESENNALWKSIVYSDYGYISYRALNDKKMTIYYFKKAFDCQDSEHQTLQRKSELLHQKAFYDVLNADYDDAYSSAKESVNLCKKLDSSFMYAKAINILAISCLGLHKENAALEHWNKAAYVCTTTSNINTHIRIYNNIGAYYFINRQIKMAKENFEIALSLYEQTSFHETSYRELFYNLLTYYFYIADDMGAENLVATHSFPELNMLFEELRYNNENKERNFDILRIKEGYFSF